ncbi:hypothetical protein HPB49_022399 [Dermacentor silvarum]|uniref:Uncharacterized protein n=1 Tax=Dermacentor silvarum TaxID=543639 RepID=A0ACB8CTG8_DERSI|nr:hypothetical protein HPB49_022399 [Dermacentor silvarum]
MCLLLHIRSPAAYDFLRRNDLMPLPAVSTVRKYISLVRPECGFDGKFFEAFKKRLLSKKDIQRHGMLVFDEIQVRQGREVNAKTFSYIGQVQHHDTSEPPLADHALVFMFVPFADSYTQPVGVFASKGPTKDLEADLTTAFEYEQKVSFTKTSVRIGTEPRPPILAGAIAQLASPPYLAVPSAAPEVSPAASFA